MVYMVTAMVENKDGFENVYSTNVKTDKFKECVYKFFNSYLGNYEYDELSVEECDYVEDLPYVLDFESDFLN